MPYRQLPWEIIDEMTLRHPGYIASVVPYEGYGHHKATLFFGVPSQLYWWRAVPDNLNYAYNQLSFLRRLTREEEKTLTQAYQGRVKPFCNYFYIDSEHHLIDNGIISSARDTYNAVEVEYVRNAQAAFGATPGNPNPSAFFTDGTRKMKCNDSLREDYCRWFHTRERNCETDAYAQRYCLGYLFRHLKDLYTGELVITGEPSMKPYDQVFLYDSYNDMSGPIEVEQVTHIFSQETGFVTVITPDLVVQTNEYLSMSLVDSLATYMGSVWLGYQKKQFASGQVGSLELGDLPWTGVGGSGRETFSLNGLFESESPHFEPRQPFLSIWQLPDIVYRFTGNPGAF